MSAPEKRIAYHLGFSDVIRVLRLVDETPFQELQLELGELKVRIVRDGDGPVPAQPAGTGTPEAETGPPESPEPAVDPGSAAPPSPIRPESEGVPVTAPLAGTFYRSPYPGEPPFAEVGAAVRQGDVVGILEIMKLMNHVKAPCSGVVREFCARNEEFVEYGHVLAIIEPDPGSA